MDNINILMFNALSHYPVKIYQQQKSSFVGAKKNK
jgi:hypothetical protein